MFHRVVAGLGIGVLMSLVGCASVQEQESVQLAYGGGAAVQGNPCAFGGVTPRAAAHCALVNFGPEGLIAGVNAAVIAGLPRGADCEVHAKNALEAMRAYRDLHAQPIYSCPPAGAAAGVCHVSVLVRDGGGRDYVMDNGAVLGRNYNGHVGALSDFASRVNGQYWVGKAPTGLALLGLEFDQP